MSIFFAVLYVGGVVAYPDRKIGFFDRMMWPSLLGQRLAEWAWETRT
jgi:hypothetical protein